MITCPHCHHSTDQSTDTGTLAVCTNCGSPLPGEGAQTVSLRSEARTVGKFQLIERIGSGAYGGVWKATDTELGRTVAIKMLHPGLIATPSDEQRFLREARAAAQLRHPGIVTIHEVAELDGLPAIVGEYIDGATLRELIDARPISFREAAALIAQVAEALDYAHSTKLVHRDIKPANIMVEFGAGVGLNTPLCRSDLTSTSTGDATSSGSSKSSSRSGPRVLLLDFGLALRDEVEETMTAEGQIVGTPAYMSPEQAAGRSHQVDRRSDVYSLGVVLYELIAGEIPFRGSKSMLVHQLLNDEPRRPRLINPAVPPDLETICLKAMSKSAAVRYQTAMELAEDLRRYLLGKPILARPTGPLEKIWRWCQRNPALAFMSGLAVSAMFAVTLLSILFAIQQTNASNLLREEKLKTQRALDESRRLSSGLALDHSLELTAKGRPNHAALWMVSSLRIASTGASDMEHVVRMNLGIGQSLLTPMKSYFQATDVPFIPIVCPDGRSLFVRKNGQFRLHDLLTGATISELPQFAEYPLIAFSGDGRTAALADCHTGLVCVIDTVTGRKIGRPLATNIRVNRAALSSDTRLLAISPDSRLLAVGEIDHTVRLYDLTTNIARPETLEHPSGLKTMGFSGDGRYLMTLEPDAVHLWRTDDTRPDSQLLKTDQAVHYAEFCDDGKTVLTVGKDGSVTLWNSETAEATGREFQTGVTPSVVAVSPDGRILAIDSGLWSLETGGRIGDLLGHVNEYRSIAFSPDSRFVLTGNADASARLWHSADGSRVFSSLEHPASLAYVAFAPDGRSFVTCTTDGAARIWGFTPESSKIATIAIEHPMRSTEFSPDRKLLLTGCGVRKIAYGEATFSDLATGTPSGNPLKHEHMVNAVTFSPDGRTALTAGGLPPDNPQTDPRPVGAVWFWDTITRQRLREYRIHHQAINVARFSPCGQFVATGSVDHDARIWSVESGETVVGPLEHPWQVTAVTFSPDGKTLATGCSDHNGRLWDAKTGQPLGEPMEHRDWIIAMTFSPDGRFLITGSDDRTLRIWDPSSGRPVGSPIVHGDSVASVAVSPDNRTILSGCEDGTAQFWDLVTGKPIGPPLPAENYVMAVKFDENAKFAYGVSAKKSMTELNVHRWPVPARMEGDPETIARRFEIATGLTLDESGAIRVLGESEWHELRRQQD